MTTPYLLTPQGISIKVNVQPGASKTAWAGILRHELKIRLSAKPVEGQANKALCEFLSAYFQVPKSSVSIIRGNAARKKTVLIEGRQDQLVKRMEDLLSAAQGT